MTTGLEAGTAAAVMRGGRVVVQQIAVDAFGNAFGGAFVDNMQRPGTGESSLYSLAGSTGSGVGLRLGGGVGVTYGGLRATGEPSFDDPADIPAFDMPVFEGIDYAGEAAAPRQLIKVGASAAWKGHQQAVYGALDDLNAALSMGGQDATRLAELRNGAIDTLNSRRIAMQTDPVLMKEVLSRGLTDRRDVDTLGLLGAFGETDAVHRIAVAVSQAGGAGRATAQGISAQLQSLDSFGASFVNRIPGEMSIEAAAPGLYLNTLLGMRNHVDSTMLYVASMTGDQMAQLGRYTDTVMAQGGMTRYQDNERLAGLFSGMQTTSAGLARVGEGLSVASLGLQNFASSLGQSIGNMNPEILANSTIGKMLNSAVGPMYVVPKTAGGTTFVVANHGDMPSPRPGQQSHHGVMSAWMKARYPGYDPDLAPAVLMPDANHRATFGVYNTWRAETRREMGGMFDWSRVPETNMRVLSEKMFDAAAVPAATREQYWNRFNLMKGALEK